MDYTDDLVKQKINDLNKSGFVTLDDEDYYTVK